ncbi:pre-mRNA processing factor 3-domain-containing protein [Crepidotus variabilis]|uniref:Pre-mRNA processing factor 3-domain-containing protein n=1 Tax=Crepidotus variabilis TaxID=179855 RepID=A0A9P6E6B3_9AGAR|nr:pre-mRNA processing factor 3-domain-containing protein [Crepidotus variabilis]
MDYFAKKRAEIAAKAASMLKNNPSLAGLAKPPPSRSSSSIAAPAPRVPVIPASDPNKVVYAATPSPVVSSGPTPATPASGGDGGSTPAVGSDEFNRKIAEARRRVADAKTKLAVKDNPYMSVALANKKKPTPSATPSATPSMEHQGGGGLKMAAHPLLLDSQPSMPFQQSKKDRYKPMQPKFASIKANVRAQPSPSPAPGYTPILRETPSVNPYVSAGLTPSSGSNATMPGAPGSSTPGGGGSSSAEPTFTTAPSTRSGRKFHFNPKGKYVALADKMRQEQQLEALKKRIEESARRLAATGEGGLGAVVEGVEKGIKRQPPPSSEWWDASLLPNGTKSYEEVIGEGGGGWGKCKIRTGDSPILIFVQHPIPIPAVDEKGGSGGGEGVELKPMKLTTKEMKKMRRLRRKAELEDKRDRIRMGLMAPEAPKVRLANLMKVLTTDAIQDPTRVEARVRREVAMRRHTHEKMNAERKLTDEQRREKKEQKKNEEEKRGLVGAVFKVNILSDPSHQFKVRRNAEQLALSGVCIFNPSFNLVYVEGAHRFVKQYKKLMVGRIKWREAARGRGGADIEMEDGNSDGSDNEEGGAGKASAEASGDKAGGGASEADASSKPKEENVVDLSNNKCVLIWEGAIRDREFGNFRAKSCPTDREAKEFLGEKMKGYWDVARAWKDDDDE